MLSKNKYRLFNKPRNLTIELYWSETWVQILIHSEWNSDEILQPHSRS